MNFDSLTLVKLGSKKLTSSVNSRIHGKTDNISSSLKAKILALENFVMNKLYKLNLSDDQVRT